MVNALEPDTDMPIHRHCSSSEIVMVLREKVLRVYTMTTMAARSTVFLWHLITTCAESVYPKVNGTRSSASKAAP